ncbi:PucR family transcriptional regulator [Streptomyces chartreusis]
MIPIQVTDAPDAALVYAAPHRALGRYDLETLEQTACHLVPVTSWRSAILAAATRQRGVAALIPEILYGRVRHVDVADRLREHGVDAGPLAVGSITWRGHQDRPPGGAQEAGTVATSVVEHAARQGLPIAAAVSGWDVIIFVAWHRPVDSLSEWGQQLTTALDGLGANVVLGLAGPISDGDDVRDALMQARSTAYLLAAGRGDDDGPVAWARSGPASTVLAGLACLPQEHLRDLVDQSIKPLKEYDAGHDADLLHTLRVLVRHGGSTVAVAAALPAHRNTVDRRADKIKTLTGLDPRNDEDRLSLAVALRADALAAEPLLLTQAAQAAGTWVAGLI